MVILGAPVAIRIVPAGFYSRSTTYVVKLEDLLHSDLDGHPIKGMDGRSRLPAGFNRRSSAQVVRQGYSFTSFM